MHSIALILHLIINLVFDAFLLILLLRLLLQWFKADMNNPFGEMIMKVSNPVLKPICAIVPSIGGIDWGTIVAILAISFVQHVLLFVTGGGHGIVGVVEHTFGGVLRLTYYIYFFATILALIAQYVPAPRLAAIMSTLNQLINPPLSFIRKYIQPMGKLDLASLVFLVLLFILNEVVVRPLMS